MALGRITITIDVATLVQDHQLEDGELESAMRDAADIIESAIDNALNVNELESSSIDIDTEETE